VPDNHDAHPVMLAAVTEPQPDDAQRVLGVEDFYGRPDNALEILVAAVNRAQSIEIGVTLHVSGIVVSGLLISGQSFFDLLGRWLAETGSSENAPIREALAGWPAHFVEQYRADERRPDDSEDHGEGRPPRTITYIHMRDASVVGPGLPPLPGILWRGRLSHVSGWSLGRFD
jgi:hypothetical protein